MRTHLSLSSPEATAALAARVANAAGAGDTILLDGPMAVGKTAFATGFAEALDATDPVSSPTYTLAHLYRTPSLTIVHVDAYRLSGPAEFLDLGLEEEMADGVTLIEWAERLGNSFRGALRVQLDFVRDRDATRTAALSSDSPRWKAFLEAVA